MSLEDVRIHVIYRVNPSEYGIRILVAAPQEYVNIYSTRRAPAFCRSTCGRGCRSVTQITSQGYVCCVCARVLSCTWWARGGTRERERAKEETRNRPTSRGINIHACKHTYTHKFMYIHTCIYRYIRIFRPASRCWQHRWQEWRAASSWRTPGTDSWWAFQCLSVLAPPVM